MAAAVEVFTAEIAVAKSAQRDPDRMVIARTEALIAGRAWARHCGGPAPTRPPALSSAMPGARPPTRSWSSRRAGTAGCR